MANLPPELIAKAKTAKSAEELLALAKENGIELTAEEAKTYFAQLSASGAVSDDELDAVSGGWDCPDNENEQLAVGARVKILCSNCGHKVGEIKMSTDHSGRCVRCVGCMKLAYAHVDDKNLERAD